jgi:hypothetical protein
VKIILKWRLKKWGMHWIQMAQNRVKWTAPVNTIMNHLHNGEGISWQAELIVFQEGLFLQKWDMICGIRLLGLSL